MIITCIWNYLKELLVSVEVAVSFYPLSISNKRDLRKEGRCVSILYFQIDFENYILSDAKTENGNL